MYYKDFSSNVKTELVHPLKSQVGIFGTGRGNGSCRHSWNRTKKPPSLDFTASLLCGSSEVKIAC